MSNGTMPPNSAQKNAQKYFQKSEQSETSAKHTHRTERQANAAKMAKLRDLRLARDQADQEEAAKRTAEEAPGKASPPVAVRRKRVAPAKAPGMQRIIF